MKSNDAARFETRIARLSAATWAGADPADIVTALLRCGYAGCENDRLAPRALYCGEHTPGAHTARNDASRMRHGSKASAYLPII